MAFTAEICGFEGGDGTGVAILSAGSVGTTAVRSGTYGFSLSVASGATNNFGVQVGKGIAGITSGHQHAAFGQFFYRMHAAPTANNSMLCGYADWFYLTVNTDMSCTIHVAGVGTTPLTLPSPSATTWYRVRMNQWTTNGALSTDPFGTVSKFFNVVVDLIDANGVTQFTSTSITLGASNIGFTSLEPLTLGSLAAVGGAKPTWALDFDDTIYVAATESDVTAFVKWSSAAFAAGSPIFRYDSIRPVLITGQGTHDGFSPAGAYTNVNEVPKNNVAVVTGSGSGTWTDYLHQDDPGTVVEAFTLRVNANVSSISVQALTVDSTEYSYTFRDSGSSNETSPFATNTYPTTLLGNMLTPAQFNAMLFGVKCKDANLTTLRNIYVEVLAGDPLIGDVDPMDSPIVFSPNGGQPVEGDLTFTGNAPGFRLANQGEEINVPVSWQLNGFQLDPRSEETS